MPDTKRPFDPEEDDDNEPEESDEHTAAGAGARLREAIAVERDTVLAERYQIEQELGRGGSGTVYRGWDRMLGELVAIKILLPERAREKSWIRRLAREVKLARAIRHPNVCRVFELGHAGGHWFVTLELATGGSLRDGMREPTAAMRPMTERLADMRALAAGLAAIHAVGITHRDVTPQNVLRMADGRVVLTDFGLAIEHDDKTTLLGGTPAYLPPEVARGERSDQRSDVFQLGMILHEILHGIRPPWSTDGTRLVLVEPSTGASTVEEELSRLIAECVDANPAKRPANAVAVAGRLAAAEAAKPASPVVRFYARARRFARRYALPLRVAAGGLALAGLLRAVQVASRPPLCRGGAEQLAGIWDGARAASIEQAFNSVGKVYAAETFTRVRAALDDYAKAWTQMYTDACEATNVRGEQSAEVLDLRMGCLKQERGDLKATTDLFVRADGDVVSRAIAATSFLPAIAHCADVAVLRAVVRPPEDPETRSRVDALRERLAAVRALHEAGRWKSGVDAAKQIVEEARALGYDPLLAETLQVLGRFHTSMGALVEADASLDEAMIRSEASRHDRALAEAAVDKTTLLGVSRRFADLERFVPRAKATLARIGGDPRLEGWIDTNIAFAMNDEGNYAEALRLSTRAVEIKQKVLGPQHWDVAISLWNVAAAQHGLGREEEALATSNRAIAMLESGLGSQHPELAVSIAGRGEIRLALDQPAEARTDLERALAIWRSEPPPEESLSYPLLDMGLSFLAEGKPDQAIASLEEADRIRQKHDMPPRLRAETQFALARALWQSASDRARALRLAKNARELFPQAEHVNRQKVEQTLTEWNRQEVSLPTPPRRP